MIDIENIVVDTIYNAVIAAGMTCDVTSDYTLTPATFPTIFVYEASNTAYPRSFDDALKDNHVNVMYVVDVFALTKREAKRLRDITDEAMQTMKFTRSYSAPTLNIDKTVKRYTSRYTAVVGAPLDIGSDTIYQIYRS